MLKGQVFARQLFENQIFALFIDTFLNGTNGVSDNYKNSMEVTYSGSNVTVSSGAICIQGRFLEEDTSTTLAAGTDTMFCKLVIEIDLDKTNTESSFLQGEYKIVKSATAYPTLTQTNIVKNNAGIYQYELARFKTTSAGITDFQDMRTFLDFDNIYEEIRQHIEDIDSGSLYFEKANFAVLTGSVASTDDSATINYPTGFAKNNCVVISCMTRYSNTTSTVGYSHGSIFKTTDGTNGSNPIRVTLRDSDISINVRGFISINNVNDQTTVSAQATHNEVQYKIVLMKLS